MESGKSNRWVLWLAASALLGAGTYTAWWLTTQNTPPPTKVEKPAGSSLSNITLTEVDKNGKLLWEIKAERAEYSDDRRKAAVLKITSKFFRDGKPIIEAVGEGGSIDQSSREITIEGNVKAIALKDNIKLSADRMVWQSDQDLLTATGNVKVEKVADKITITGKILKANPGANRFTIQKDVVATVVKPPLKLESPILTWEANQNLVIGQAPFRIVQTKDDVRIRADRGEWNTVTQKANLNGNVRVRAPKSNLEVLTAKLTWDVVKQLITLPTTINVSSQSRGVSIAANSGQINLASQKVNLIGNIEAISKTNQAVLTSDTVEWLIPEQQITVEGNVNYRQTEKNVNVKGSKAVTNLAAQTIQITGTDVVTQITP